jgi:hypothetical protein
MKRARRARRENPKSQSRLARAAFESTSGALLNRDAIAGERDYFARKKMRLDDCGTVGLTGEHGQSIFEGTFRRGECRRWR